MHSRRLASLLIGAWLAASIFMDFVAVENFRSVDRFLNAPDALSAEQIHTMGGKADARVFLRHQAGEVNRFLFEQWEYVQLSLGTLLILVFVFGHGEAPRVALLLAGLMLVVVAVDRLFLTPEITRLGRLLDVPNQAGAAVGRFWKLHGAYSGLELLKIGLGIVAGGTLVIRFNDRQRFVREHQKSSRSQPDRTASSGIS